MKDKVHEIIADLHALEARMLPNRSFTSNADVLETWASVRTKILALLEHFSAPEFDIAEDGVVTEKPNHHTLEVQGGKIGGGTKFPKKS
jgi:hypothetical protein